MEYRVISADTHLDIKWLPQDLFVANAPAHLKDSMPRVEEREKGPCWAVQGEFIDGVGGIGITDFVKYVPGESRRQDRMVEAGFLDGVDKGIYHPAVAELRIKDQDIDGVDAEVMYGILGIGGGDLFGAGPKDGEVLATIYSIYNEWVADFVKAHPERLGALACITSHDPQVAAQQLRRAAEIGLKGAEINVAKMVEPVYHGDWDVLWSTAGECDMPISFHTLGISHRKPKPADQERYQWVDMGLNYILFQLSGAEFMTSIILSGACERYPDFSFVLGECGIGWIPYVIERTDFEYETMLYHLGLELKPSEYWRRQGYSTFQQENVSVDQVQRIGADNIMWGSDYPHADCVFPDSLQVIEEGLGHLDQSTRKKIVCDNAAQLYRFN